MNGVLILIILMAVSSASEDPVCPRYRGEQKCILFPYLETSGAVSISDLTNKDATLSAISSWMDGNGLGNETKGKDELKKRRTAIRKAYADYHVSMRRWINPA